MREFTKSMLSFSWAMSMFPVQQMLNLLAPEDKNRQTDQATKAFNSVTKSIEEELRDVTKATFKAGDNLQKRLVDMTLGAFTLQAFNPGRWMRMTSDILQQSTEAAQQGIRMTSNVMQQSAQAVRAGTQGDQADQGKRKDESASGSSGWGPVK